MVSSTAKPVKKISLTLRLAGIYNLVFGGLVILFPAAVFQLTGIPSPRYPEIWQCVGMIVGVYGIGYLIASKDPDRHWPIVLVGLLGKVFGPIGFLTSPLPLAFGILILFNDLVWWIPFSRILLKAGRRANLTESPGEVRFHEVVATAQSVRGRTMTELSWRQPTLFIFLRHFGCEFCRETLSSLNEHRRQIESLGLSIAIVHMGEEPVGGNHLEKYGLQSLEVFSDPSCNLYRACNIGRATYKDLLTWRTLRKVVARIFTQPFKFGKIEGDAFRLSGAIVIHQGKVVGEVRPRVPSDRLEFLSLAKEHGLSREIDHAVSLFPELVAS